ncbi:MAG: hypothetical protein EAZ89_07405, partial [Bacteroidetes bacterium]
GKEGFFYSTGDAYYAAGKIGEIFDDEALAEEMGENARRLCLERNNPDEIGKRYRDIYEGLTSKNLQALVKW